MLPQPSGYPISESFLGIDENTYSRGITELYLPYAYGQLKCEIDLFEIDAKNFWEAKLKIGFKITGDIEIKKLYLEDGWKLKTTEDLIKHLEPDREKIPKNMAPIFCLMLNRSLRVEGVRLAIDGRESSVISDQSTNLIILPDSFPPLLELPKEENYKYYERKATTFYASFELNKRYLFEIDLDCNFSFELSPLFPFGQVEFKNAVTRCFSSGDCNLKMMCGIVEPTIEKKFPEWLEKQFDRKSTPAFPMMPQIEAADPYRGKIPLFKPEEMVDSPMMIEPTKIVLPPADLDNYKLGKYQAIRCMFTHLFHQGKDFEIIVRRKKNALPVRIYDQLQYLPGYHNILVEYDILNLTKIKQTVKIETEILGYTEPQIGQETIIGMGNDLERPARIKISHCPRLKRGIINSIVSAEKGTIKCKVTDTKNNKVLFECTYEIDILPKDQMIWEVRDEKTSIVYNLRNFICSWINPVDSEGLLDKVRADAIKYHADKALGHKINSLNDIEGHVKAIYECLQKEYQIKYLNQPFNSKGLDATQRVVLPEVVIKNRAGNCIDLTILFASLLEGFGIFSLLLIMPGHAFIGWGNPEKTDQMIFLETTAIGTKTFDEAKQIAKKNFTDNFLFGGSHNPLPAFITAISKGCFIIDLKSVRKSRLVAKGKK